MYKELSKKYSAVFIGNSSKIGFGRTCFITHLQGGKLSEFVLAYFHGGTNPVSISTRYLICNELNINSNISINPKYANNRTTPIKH